MFLFESRINCLWPRSEDIDALQISHEQTAQSLALRLNVRYRKRIAVARIVHRQVREIRQSATATRSDDFVDALGANQRAVDMTGGQRGHAGRCVPRLQ